MKLHCSLIINQPFQIQGMVSPLPSICVVKFKRVSNTKSQSADNDLLKFIRLNTLLWCSVLTTIIISYLAIGRYSRCYNVINSRWCKHMPHFHHRTFVPLRFLSSYILHRGLGSHKVMIVRTVHCILQYTLLNITSWEDAQNGTNEVNKIAWTIKHLIQQKEINQEKSIVHFKTILNATIISMVFVGFVLEPLHLSGLLFSIPRCTWLKSWLSIEHLFRSFGWPWFILIYFCIQLSVQIYFPFSFRYLKRKYFVNLKVVQLLLSLYYV
jgi:hypothetical protein